MNISIYKYICVLSINENRKFTRNQDNNCRDRILYHTFYDKVCVYLINHKP